MSNPHLIGLTGLAGSGKDCVAALLGMVGYERRAFADALRVELAEILDPLIYGERIWQKPTAPEIRSRLQNYGMTRRNQDPEYWIKKVFSDEPKDADQWQSHWQWPIHDIVISDVRFPNEVDAIHARGGVVWRIVRPDVRPLDGNHVSETGIASLSVDREILNDGSLWDLQKKVTEALKA
jgi:hypothetical protein